MTENPFLPTTELPHERGVFSDHARLRRSAFLYRDIDFDGPLNARFVYTGWWFRQAVYLNGEAVWFRISWTRIDSSISFLVPPTIRSEGGVGQVEIDFTRGLTIRRFRVFIDGRNLYDEIH